jgi:hypothetical protein
MLSSIKVGNNTIMNHNIRYLSDLHLEFIESNKIEQFIMKIPSGIDEICILAGDIRTHSYTI